MTQTRKFSQFLVGGDLQDGDIIVGLRDGLNYQFNATISGGGSGEGVIITVEQPNHMLAPGNWVRINNAGLFVTALSTTDEFAEVEGVVKDLDPLDPLNKFRLQVLGYVGPGTFTGLTAGTVYFLDRVTPGLMTPTENLENGEVSLPLFIAYTDDSGYIRQFRGIVNNGQIEVFSGGGGGDGEPVIIDVTQNNTFSVGQVVYCDAVDHYALAKSDGVAVNSEKAIGFVIEATPTTFRLQQSGFFNGFVAPVAPLTPGSQYWLSAATAGNITTTEPTTTGTYTKPMLIAINATSGWILPQRPLLNTATTSNPIEQTVTQAAHGFTYIGQIVKPKTTVAGEYEAALANSTITSFGVGMISEIPDVNTFKVRQVGYITGLDIPPPGLPGGIANPSAPFTVGNGKIGKPFYLDEALAGQMTTIEPGNPNFSKPIFMPDANGAGWIFPMKPTLVSGGGGGGGGVVQMVSNQTSVPANVNYSTAGWSSVPFLTATITPTDAGNKIRFQTCINVNAQYGTYFSLFRDGVQIPVASSFAAVSKSPNAGVGLNAYQTINIMYIDEPGVIVPVTYNIRILAFAGVAGTVVASFNPGVSSHTAWTLEEITG